MFARRYNLKRKEDIIFEDLRKHIVTFRTDEKAEREEAIKKAQRKAEIKSRIAMAKQKNKVSDLDDFDDSDDDFTFTPKKKTHTDSKKEKIKPKMYFAGGGIK